MKCKPYHQRIEAITDADAVRRIYADQPVRLPSISAGGAGALVLCRNTSADALGPADTGGIALECACTVVEHLVTGGSAPSPAVTGTAKGTYGQGIILPQQTFYARYANGFYWLDGGVQTLRGVMAGDTTLGVGSATFSYNGTDTVDLVVTDPCATERTAGTTVLVNVELNSHPTNGCILNIVRACCGPLGA